MKPLTLAAAFIGGTLAGFGFAADVPLAALALFAAAALAGAVQPCDTGARADGYGVDGSQPASSAAAAGRFGLNHLNGNVTSQRPADGCGGIASAFQYRIYV